MSLLAPWFLIAGLAAAAGPVLIHLLNRRRFRVVQWAAMDFLREAVRRSRRILRIRDILLLILRTACILIFGLAMARPFFARSGAAAIDPDQPVHGVVLLDNSLSMSYEELGGTLLDAARIKARQWIERLPAGSRVSLIPLCGLPGAAPAAVYPSKEDAVDALSAVKTVDRGASAAAAIDMALEACARVPELPVKQMVLIGDQQLLGQARAPLAPQLKRLPGRLETIAVTAKDPENAWVADFRLQDDIAEAQTPAVFLATVGYQGRRPRQNVEVRLTVAGQVVSTIAVELLPNQRREIRFPPYALQVTPEQGHVQLVPAEVSITHDRLPGDDQRFLIVPVVAALPVVFVDQYGPKEDPRAGRLGETLPLRRLLAPTAANDRAEHQLVEVRHTTIDRLDQETLRDARLVVIAGVASPGPAVPVLRQYVQQGGPLLIAAGGDFDPAAWSAAAWLDGAGILPAPLRPALVGRSPEEAADAVHPFQLDFNSLVHDYFLLEQISREELQDLYHLPYFFKTAAPDVSNEVVSGLLRRTTADLTAEHERLVEIDKQLAALGPAAVEAAGDNRGAQRSALEQERQALRPAWLVWPSPEELDDARLTPAELAERSRPHTLAAFTNGVPYLVGRRIGQGRVLFVSSGFSPAWNTLAMTNAIVVFDRILHDLLCRTIPQRNFGTSDQHWEPVGAGQRLNRITLSGPAGYEESPAVDAVGGDRYAVALSNLPWRGVYRLASTSIRVAVPGAASSPTATPAPAPLWEIPIAVNGPVDESILQPPEAAGGQQTLAADDVWAAGAAAEASGAGPALWKRCMLAVLVGLLVEVVILALPALRQAVTLRQAPALAMLKEPRP